MRFFAFLVAAAPIAAATTATGTIAPNIPPTLAPDVAGDTGSFPNDLLDSAFGNFGIDLDSHNPEDIAHAVVDLTFHGVSTAVAQYGPTLSKAFEEVKTLIHHQISTGQPPEIGPNSSLGLMVQQDPILGCRTIATLLSGTVGLVNGLLGPVLGLLETVLSSLGPLLGGLLVS
ncbi:hypothetical protein PHISP_07076 [Aspergillus sp. HF37]|nr:hypothetical protein PHISP_07076 [Aspergillus sp. HF37]